MNRGIAVFVALMMLLAHVLAIQVDDSGNFAFPYDYAYTAFEYARSLVHDGTLRWGDLGDHGEGYPSLAWIVIAQFGERFTNHVNLFCQTVGILSGLLTVYLLSRVRPNRIAGLIAPLCFVCSGIAAAACGSGTEIALYTLSAVLCYWSLERDHPWRLALGLLLLVTSRVEGHFVALFLLLIYAPRVRERGLRRLLLPFLACLPGLLLSVLVWSRSSTPWLPFETLLKPLPGQHHEGWLSFVELLQITAIPLLLVFVLAALARGRLGGMGARALVLFVLLAALGIAGGRSPLVFGQAFAVAMPFLYIAVQEGIIVMLDAQSLLRRAAISAFAVCLIATGLASRGTVDLGPLPIGEAQARWMRSTGSARAGYEAQLGRAGLKEELANTERLRSIALYLRLNLPSDAQVLSPWPSAIAYVSKLEVHDLLGRTNALPFDQPRGSWTRRARVDIAQALRQQLPVVVPRIAAAARVPSPQELAEEWVREFDSRAKQPGRVEEIRGLLEQYALITVPVQSFVRAPVLPPPQPFHLLVLRSWSKLPQLRILERDGVLHVLCRHQASILTADLVVRVRRNDGSEHWLSPAGLERSSKVVANSGLQISDSGSKEFEVYRLPLDAELVGLEARLENPGAIDAGTFDSIGPAAVWQR